MQMGEDAAEASSQSLHTQTLYYDYGSWLLFIYY